MLNILQQFTILKNRNIAPYDQEYLNIIILFNFNIYLHGMFHAKTGFFFI
jgi:hypothetical protein